MRDLRHLKERVDTLFQDVLGRAGTEAAPEVPGAWRPPVDVWEEGGSYHVRVDLPGAAAGDVGVEIEEGVLHVRGERTTGGSVPRGDFLRAERPHGRFAFEVDALLERGRRTFVQEERRAAYARFQEILAEEQPYVFLYVPDALPIVAARFRGIEPASAGIGHNFIRWWVPAAEQKYRPVP